MQSQSAVVRWATTLTVMIAVGERAYAQSEAAQASAEEGGHRFLEHKPGKTLTFYTAGGGEITVYGNLDVSFDATTKGISNLTDAGGNGPVGSMGWMPALSTNLSYAGLRGFWVLGADHRFVYQLETQLDIAASAGFANTNSNSSALVKGALTSRNSFIGLSGPWGSLKVGKTDAPYKVSTARMNPFSGMIGDYQVVMSNTGGDNRVEFGTRLDHSIWYESPNLGGLGLAVLFSPGQNRSSSSANIPAGEPECAGGNIPGSGGTGSPGGFPISCNDGAFSDAVSAALSYDNGPFYATAAYERHFRVNRNSDIYGIYGVGPPLPASIAGYDSADVADEDAAKVGAQFKFPTETTLSAIFEYMHRYVPSFLSFQNERQRAGLWVAAGQRLSSADRLDVGWAHAFRTPGDPGQHNTSTYTPPGGVAGAAAGGPDVDNKANMITVALRHDLGNDVTAYLDWAMTINAPYAHYDLGAGGRAVTTDCHEAGLPASGDVTASPHCWAGGRLAGVSLGLNAKF